MKGKFDAYVLLAKRVQNWIVDRSTACDITVVTLKPICFKPNLLSSKQSKRKYLSVSRNSIINKQCSSCHRKERTEVGKCSTHSYYIGCTISRPIYALPIWPTCFAFLLFVYFCPLFSVGNAPFFKVSLNYLTHTVYFRLLCIQK